MTQLKDVKDKWCVLGSRMFQSKTCFFSLPLTPALGRRVRTVRTWPMCSCGDLVHTEMLFKYTRENCHLTVECIKSIVR